MQVKGHESWMKIALDAAQQAAEQGEVPVGAVLVVDNALIAVSVNSCVADNDPSAHAEINVLRKAGAEAGNYRLAGATLYVTLEPCVMCAGAIVNARVKQLVYGVADHRAGAAGSLVNVLQTPFLNHQCDIVAGVLEDRCRELVQDFFRVRR